MRAAVCRGLAVGCALAAGWMAMPLVAGADEPVETGWWSRENGGNPIGAPVAAPRPSDVPEGGLLVAQDIAGPSAVSGLRFQAQVAAPTTLMLTLADGLQELNPPEIVACPPASGWGAADYGEWFVRPEGDCDRGQVTGVVSGDTITWALTPAFKREGAATIEVVLSPSSDQNVTRAAFEKPGPDALTAAVDLGATTTSSTLPPTPATTAAPFPSFGGATEKQFGGPQVAAPPTTEVPPPTTTPSTAPATDELAAGVPAAVAAPDSTGERLFAVALLGALALAFALAAPGGPALPTWAGGLPLLGRWAGKGDAGREGSREREGGVGRFVRSREDPPTRL